VPVHHVEMDPVGAGLVDGADLFAEFRKIRRQDRRRDHQRAGRNGLRHRRSPWVAFGAEASRNMGQALEQCRQTGAGEAGKFCRSGIICREIHATTAAKTVVLSAFFLWHAAC
jgi:hypothetical protein